MFTVTPGTGLEGEAAGRKEASEVGRKTRDDRETKRRVRELTAGFKGRVSAKANAH